MPLLLDTPHHYSAGHGVPDADQAFVMIVRMDARPVARSMILWMEYGNVVGGAWVPSGEPAHSIRIQNVEAVMASGIVDIPGEGEDPPTQEWREEETTPANPAYDDMKAALLIDAAHVGEQLYTVLGGFLYAWLLEHGHYQGTIE